MSGIVRVSALSTSMRIVAGRPTACAGLNVRSSTSISYVCGASSSRCLGPPPESPQPHASSTAQPPATNADASLLLPLTAGHVISDLMHRPGYAPPTRTGASTAGAPVAGGAPGLHRVQFLDH